MEENPYSKIMTVLQPGAKGLILRRGKVKTAAPLVVELGGITVSGAELLVNAGMLTHKARIIPINPELAPFYATVDPQLSAGDTVLMLTEDDQLFYILCKVVGV